MDQAKRTKIMLALVIILGLVVVLSKKKSTGSSSNSGLLDKITGVNINQKVREFQNTMSKRDNVMYEKNSFIKLSDELNEAKVNLWSYSKAGSPRGEAQQKLNSLAKSMGIEDVRVSIGFERNVPSCEYLKMIDFSVTSRKFEMKNIADFMDAVDNDTKKFYWGDCKIYQSGKSFSFSANIRIYVLNKKAVELLGKK